MLTLLLGGCQSASNSTKPASQTPQSAEQNVPPTNTTNPNSSSPRSEEEVIADLDHELDESIAVFDGMILDERAKAEAIEASIDGSRNDRNGDQEGVGNGESLFEDGDIYEGLPGYGDFPEGSGDDDTGNNQQASTEEGDTGTTSSDDNDKQTSAAGEADKASGLETSKAGGIPVDIEGGSDDDIVARQIREAALKEKDPVLRDKLWDEYRKYKNQQRAE